jgi:ribosomal protein S18 acetylase RimI-like enzyme
VGQSGQAEFRVIDDFQGLGIGTALMTHLAAIARAAGVRGLVADVLSDNAPMLAVFKNSGESGVLHVTIKLR